MTKNPLDLFKKHIFKEDGAPVRGTPSKDEHLLGVYEAKLDCCASPTRRCRATCCSARPAAPSRGWRRSRRDASPR